MDCCDSSKHEDKEEKTSNNSEPKDKTLILIGIGIVFLVAVFFAFKLGSSNAGIADLESSGKIDTTGWTTNEIMNYEMHGTVPARVGKISVTTSAPGGMVGGC